MTGVLRGRLEIGLGAAWNAEEYEAHVIDFPAVAERMDRLDEACAVIDGILTQGRTTFDGGHHHQLTDARSDPKALQRPRPPFVLCGQVERRMLRIAARDGPPQKLVVLHAHCAELGGFPSGFSDLASGQVLPGVQVKVLYLALLAVAPWYVVEHTPFGRYLQATGHNPEAARLAEVGTNRYVFLSLVSSATIAGVAGVVQTADVGARLRHVRIGVPAACLRGGVPRGDPVHRPVHRVGDAGRYLGPGLRRPGRHAGGRQLLLAERCVLRVCLIITAGLSCTLERVRLGRMARGRARRAGLARSTAGGTPPGEDLGSHETDTEPPPDSTRR